MPWLFSALKQANGLLPQLEEFRIYTLLIQAGSAPSTASSSVDTLCVLVSTFRPMCGCMLTFMLFNCPFSSRCYFGNWICVYSGDLNRLKTLGLIRPKRWSYDLKFCMHKRVNFISVLHAWKFLLHFPVLGRIRGSGPYTRGSFLCQHEQVQNPFEGMPM